MAPVRYREGIPGPCDVTAGNTSRKYYAPLSAWTLGPTLGGLATYRSDSPYAATLTLPPHSRACG